MIDILNIASPEWMAHPGRNCDTSSFDHPKELGAAADDWFQTGTDETTASRLCGGCPVATRCLTYALDNPEVEGVWGGTTHKQRLKAITKKKNPQPAAPAKPIVTRDECGTTAGYSKHRKHHEALCPECRTAWNAYRAAWRNGKKDVA